MFYSAFFLLLGAIFISLVSKYHSEIIITPQNEIIDIFFLFRFIHINDESYKWYSSPLFLKNNAGWKNSKIRVHILSDISEMMKEMKNQSILEGFYLVDLDTFVNETRKFEKIYKHQSSNVKNYEFWCFNRWHIFKEYVNYRKDLKISTVITLDNDVLIFKDIHQLVKSAMVVANVTSYDFLSLEAGGFTIWSIAGLTEYSNYIYHLYSDHKKLHKYIIANGTTSNNAPHLSDIYTLWSFVKDDSYRRFLFYGYNVNNIFNMNDNTICIKDLGSLKKAKAILFQNGLPYNMDASLPNVSYCWGHFQGDMKKYIEIFANKYASNFNGVVTLQD